MDEILEEIKIFFESLDEKLESKGVKVNNENFKKMNVAGLIFSELFCNTNNCSLSFAEPKSNASFCGSSAEFKASEGEDSLCVKLEGNRLKLFIEFLKTIDSIKFETIKEENELFMRIHYDVNDVFSDV